MDVEKKLIARMLFKEEIQPVLDWKVHPGMFVDEKAKNAFVFVTDFYRQYGELPSIDLVEEKFPELSMVYAKEPAEYYIDELMENYARNKGTEVVKKHAGDLIVSPRKGLDTLTKKLLELGMEVDPAEDVNLLETMDDRKKRYLEIKDGGVFGYPSPWDVLDEATLGWHPGEFVAVVGRPGIGKTWGAILLAEHAWKAGHSVMFVTMEMGIDQIAQRFDALHHKLPYQEFRSGLLPDGLEKQYLESKVDTKDKAPFWLIRNVGGIASLGSKIDQYKPEVVFVDGMYLLDDDFGGRNMWERVTNVSKSMKKLAQKKNLPIIATTQFNRATDERRIERVTLANIGFSDSLGQDADVVIGQFRTRDMELNNELMIRILKCREGAGNDFTVTWDLHRMRFDVIGRVNDNEVINDGETEFDDATLDF